MAENTAKETGKTHTHAHYGGLKEKVVLSRGERCSKFCYDPDTHYWCGRSCKNICFVLFFHICFYIALFGYLAILLYIDYIRRDKDIPQDNLLSGFTFLTDPGLSMLPKGDQKEAAMVLKFSLGESPSSYVEELQNFLNGYDGKPTFLHPCNKKAPGDACIMKADNQSLGPCNVNNTDKFGYSKGKPCILFKFNRIYGWLPEVDGNSYNIPIKCESVAKLYSGFYTRASDLIVKVYPEAGINGLCFPFCGKHMTYVQPFVMVQFENIPLNQKVAILCMAENLKNVPEIDHPQRIEQQIGSIGFIIHIEG